MKKQPSLLYVEDNKDTAKAVKVILETLGYSVELAFTGTEGLAKLEKEDFDLVILDVMLPDMSGMEIFQKVKGKKNNSKYAFLSVLPISMEKLSALKKEGVVDYINKPFRKDDLIQRIKKAVEGK